MKASFYCYNLNFKIPAGTSRGILNQKKTYFIKLEQENKVGIGECPFFNGLSYESENDLIKKLNWICNNINLPKQEIYDNLKEFSSLKFGLEQAFINLNSENNFIFFPSEFTQNKKGIKINGLIWMGTFDFMNNQIKQKLSEGFKCLKLKIGTNWNEEKILLTKIREKYNENQLEIRVDANGAFTFEQSKKILEELNNLKIHSIEQPIKAKNYDQMEFLCKNFEIPIALDEDLIGIFDDSEKNDLVNKIKPKYLIFKPSLIGGIESTKNWIEICEKNNINWWITSALESNIALNFIAQWTFTLNNKMPQGLGTGTLYTNNFETPLKIIKDELFFIN